MAGSPSCFILLAACKRGGLCCNKKIVIFILFIRFVKILILLYICMFLWNLLFLAIQVIPIFIIGLI